MFLDCSWIVVLGLVLDCSWIVPGLFLDCFCIVPGVFLDCSWIFPGLFLDCSWIVLGLFLACSWIVPGIFLDAPGLFLDHAFVNHCECSCTFLDFLGLFLECFWIVLHCSRIVLGCSWMLASFAQPESASKSHVLSGSHSIRFTGYRLCRRPLQLGYSWLAGCLAGLDGCWLDAWKLETFFLYSHTLDVLKGSADDGKRLDFLSPRGPFYLSAGGSTSLNVTVILFMLFTRGGVRAAAPSLHGLLAGFHLPCTQATFHFPAFVLLPPCFLWVGSALARLGFAPSPARQQFPNWLGSGPAASPQLRPHTPQYIQHE